MAKKKASSKSPSKAQTKSPQRRQFIRFAPDPGAIALVLSDANGKKIDPPLPCLIIEEAYGGVGLIAIKSTVIKKSAVVVVQVGKLPKMKGEIRWVKVLEDKFVYFGVVYLD